MRQTPPDDHRCPQIAVVPEAQECGRRLYVLGRIGMTRNYETPDGGCAFVRK